MIRVCKSYLLWGQSVYIYIYLFIYLYIYIYFFFTYFGLFGSLGLSMYGRSTCRLKGLLVLDGGQEPDLRCIWRPSGTEWWKYSGLDTEGSLPEFGPFVGQARSHDEHHWQRGSSLGDSNALGIQVLCKLYLPIWAPFSTIPRLSPKVYK